MKNFVHLHNHTEYSLLDGSARINKLIKRAKELNMEALAITDHGVMYGVLTFYQAAKKAGIKPIIGCEVYVAPRGRMDKDPQKDAHRYHLVLLAENQQGYANLCRLVSYGFLEGFYYKPRVDKELLKKYSSGIIALSACLAGELPRLISDEQFDKAKATAQEYQTIFGKDNFFIELQQHGIEEQYKVNAHLIEIAKELEIPLVATNDTHYVHQSDSEFHDTLLCIQTGSTKNEINRMRFDSDQFYLKSPDEMEMLFGEYPEALTNTTKIAERCNVDFSFDKLYLPNYEVPEGYTLENYLKELCYQGMENRYGSDWQKHADRLNYELEIINTMGYPGYFLIVWDLVKFAKEQNILVGPGRGSAAGSIVSYALGITNVDPIKYNLIFERFLNPERVSMPDIDIDFCYMRRGEVIDYLVDKYGKDNVAQIITFGTMKAKAAIKDVGRALDIPYDEVDKISKMIPFDLGITIEKFIDGNKEIQELYEQDEQIKELIDSAKHLEGMPRHASTHAAGVVIAKDELMHYMPVQKLGEGIMTTQFEKNQVEEQGLLKMDILGLRTLTVMGDAIKNIKASKNIEIILDDIPLDDKKAYALIAAGNNDGVFQLESDGIRTIARNLNPEKLEDLIALVALYRPGPLGSGMVDDFIDRKHKKVPVVYEHPILEPILKETYGVILYQEQVMQIAEKMAGFSLGQADILRRAMGNKNPQEIAALKENFLEGAAKNNVDQKIANHVFELMEYFSGYGFNKSHSAAYGLIAYQTAWLKANYPVEYMAALLSSIMDNTDKVTEYIEACHKNSIDILPPHVNESRAKFTVVKNGIRFGLAAVKNVGWDVIKNIITEREKHGAFTSYSDFASRVPLNRRMLDSLIKCGALDNLGANRAQMLAIIDQALDMGRSAAKEKDSKQISLFDIGLDKDTDGSYNLTLPDEKEFDNMILLKMEKETLGFYVSGHPLEAYQLVVSEHTSHNSKNLTQAMNKSSIILAGIISNFKSRLTRRGDLMAIFQLEDFYGQIHCLMFPQTYESYEGKIDNGDMVLLKGTINKEDEKNTVFANSLKPLDDIKVFNNSPLGVKNNQAYANKNNFTNPRGGKLYLSCKNPADETFINDLKTIINCAPGPNPLILYAEDSGRYQPDPFAQINAQKIMPILEEKWGQEKICFISE